MSLPHQTLKCEAEISKTGEERPGPQKRDPMDEQGSSLLLLLTRFVHQEILVDNEGSFHWAVLVDLSHDFLLTARDSVGCDA